jgi:hypothetical protein
MSSKTPDAANAAHLPAPNLPASERNARLSAALVGAGAFVTVGLQCGLDTADLMAKGATLPEALFRCMSYFTITSNLMVAVVLTCAAGGLWTLTNRDGPKFPAQILGAVTVWIAMVGLVYHFILSSQWSPEGLRKVSDLGVHYVVPALTVLWWIVFAPKAGLRLWDAAIWLVWPLAWTGVTLARGVVAGFYPYSFLNLSELGAAQVAVNVAGLAIAFAVAGLVLAAAGKVLSARGPASSV